MCTMCLTFPGHFSPNCPRSLIKTPSFEKYMLASDDDVDEAAAALQSLQEVINVAVLCSLGEGRVLQHV